jgi:putative peptidoglycan binding protein
LPQYVVKQGDCILSIAKDFGFFWETLWNDPQNASLKQLRKDPNVLLTGDVVYIRDKQIKEESKPTDALASFVRKGTPAQLRLQLLDRNQQPRANLQYTLVIDGKSQGGTSDSNGWINETMPPNAKKADLIVVDQGVPEKYAMGLGTVDPITVTTGVEQRLKNLGHSTTSGLSQAVKSFQKKYGLPVTGDPDDATREKLKSIHGC